MDKTRVEALSDGVFAVAITLLVLNIKLPGGGVPNGQLLTELRHILPNIIAYVLSFCMVGIFWNGHHTILKLTKAIDSRLIWLNLLYLMVVVLMPFLSSTLADNYQDPVAVILYSSALIVIGALHFIFVNYIYRQPALRHAQFTPERIQRSKLASTFGAACGLLAIIAAFVNIKISLALLFLVPVYYIFFNRSNERLSN